MPERDATLDAFVTEEQDEVSDDAEETAIEEQGDIGNRDDGTDTREASGGDGSPDGVGDQDTDGVAGVEGDESDELEPSDGDQPVTAATDIGDEQAVTTYSWSPDGAVCEACGTASARRWWTDAGMVCPGCVDWERTPNQ